MGVDGSDCLHCSVVQIGCHLDFDTLVLFCEFLQHLVGEVGVCASQSADQGEFEVDQLGCLDDAGGDGVALHDTSEDIDENGFDIGVG